MKVLVINGSARKDGNTAMFKATAGSQDCDRKEGYA